jgi:hypothetical protein
MTSALYLHNPMSRAHLEDLRDRLVGQLARVATGDDRQQVLVTDLVDVVRAMDRGSITPKEALDTFARHPVPGFSFGRWLVEMVDEGVYLEDLYNEAA